MITATDLSIKYAVKQTEKGNGIFAAEDVSANTVLLKITGHYLNFAQTAILGENEANCLQIDLDTYIAPHYPFFMSNHSCEPNCGINPRLEFITLQAISKGTELVWDYSTSMLERHWNLPCNCGTPSCRKLIKDFDQLPKELQQKYLGMGIVMPYIHRFFEIIRDLEN